MEALSGEPRSLRELVEADLRRGARLIIKIQDEIDWQFRIATPKGDYHLAITMPAADEDRNAMLGRVAVFMMWKQALAYVLVAEMSKPDSVYAVGVSRSEAHHCLTQITRTPRPWTAGNFSAVEWLATSDVSPVLTRLLPRVPRAMKPKHIHELQDWFGVTGKFPAVHLPTGEVRGA